MCKGIKLVEHFSYSLLVHIDKFEVRFVVHEHQAVCDSDGGNV